MIIAIDDAHARFQHLGPVVYPGSSYLRYPISLTSTFAYHEIGDAYMTPDSNPNITRFSPFSVNRMDRGITPLASLISFQFLLHNASKVPEDDQSNVQMSSEVLHTIFFYMEHLDFSSVARHRQSTLVLIVVHRFNGLIERHRRGARELLELVLLRGKRCFLIFL